VQRFNKKICLYGLVSVLSAALLIAVAACFISTEPERQEPPALPHVDVPVPELKATEEDTREIIVSEIIITPDVTPEPESAEIIMPELESAEIITPEPEAAEDVTQETEIEEFAESTEEPDFTAYDIPLSAELQRYTFDLCRERGLDFEIVLALMYAESSYRPDVISRTDDYGIMQINKVNHNWLRTELGITDFLDAEQSINAGTFILMKISEGYPDTHQMLMAYNMGESGAKNCWNRGIYSTQYSRKITARADELKNSNPQ